MKLCTAVKKVLFAIVLKCKACLNTKFKCMCGTMCSLVMSPFSHDYIYENRNTVDLLKYQQCFNLLTMYTVFTQRLVFRW